jgi:hypothetical protein
MTGKWTSLLTSKTVWGAVIAAASWLVQQQTIGVPEVIQALGMVVAAIGVRQAISASASPDSPEGEKKLNG